MKKLLAVITICLLFFGAGVMKSFGTNEFEFDSSTYLYNKLGLGSYEAMSRFVKEQSRYVTVLISNQSGDQDSNATPYPQGQDEPFQDFFLRTANTQLQHAIAGLGFNPNQQFSVKCTFKSASSNGVNKVFAYDTQMYSSIIWFTPQVSNGLYTAPNSITNLLSLSVNSADTQVIPWTQIKQVSLVVLDPNGKLVYSGDTKFNSPTDSNLSISSNRNVFVSKRFVTNGYTGVLTAATGSGPGAVYLMKNGVITLQPTPPVLTINKLSTNGMVVSIKGGSPYQSIQLLSSSNPGAFPSQGTNLNLDRVGSVIWTNTSTSNCGFYKVVYPQ